MSKKKKKKQEIPFKRDIDEIAITEYCDKHGMKVHFTINLIFITTPFGSWYFDTQEERIRLFHKNSRIRTEKDFKNSFGTDYHDQHKKFDNIFTALSYIHTHDFNKLKREAKYKLIK